MESFRELIYQFCKNCGCELFQQPYGFGYILKDNKREIIVEDFNDICFNAIKLQKLRKLEEQIVKEKDCRKRRKILNHLFFIDNCQNSSSGRAGD